MDNNQIYEEIAWRTGGDIYIGVVGPVPVSYTHLDVYKRQRQVYAEYHWRGLPGVDADLK